MMCFYFRKSNEVAGRREATEGAVGWRKVASARERNAPGV
jgi:hypothetical protein